MTDQEILPQSPTSGTPANANSHPLVSVMMPAYNAQSFIAQAITSVLSQTYANWELIIVDDGSTDDTGQIAGSFSDPRIRVYHQENAGEAAARNRALQQMHGEFVAFLDADDYYLPDHLEACVRYLLDHPDRQGVYTDGQHCNQAGVLLPQTLSDRRRGPFEGSLFEEIVRASDVFGPPMCVVLHREPVVRQGLEFDPEIVIGPDWDFLTRYSENTRFGYLDRITGCYRIHQTNITLQTDMKRRALYLARCREKAIRLAGFNHLSVETRAAVFYDLLVVQLSGYPNRQDEITAWDEFKHLPDREQAHILRLMASAAIRAGEKHERVIAWLKRSRQMDRRDIRSAILLAGWRTSPSLTASVLRLRRLARKDTQETLPLQDLTAPPHTGQG